MASKIYKDPNGVDLTFKEEWIKTSDLEVDKRIQRFKLNLTKVENIVRNFNPAALGVLTVSRRNVVTNILLDGWHRWQAYKEITDNQGEMLCHVFDHLSLAQEAQLFLDLNAGNQPTLLEKFNAKRLAEDPVAVGIDQIVHSYGWTVSPIPAPANIQAIGALERIYRRSLAVEMEPNQLQIALMVISRAWGTDRFGTHAVILEGLAALYAQHQDLLDLDRLVTKLQGYPGGPRGLHTDATQMGTLRRVRVSMAVADLVTNEYNRGKTSKALPPWRKRNP